MSLSGARSFRAYVFSLCFLLNFFALAPLSSAWAISAADMSYRNCRIKFGTSSCSGFLLNTRRVLTANHCLANVTKQPVITCYGTSARGVAKGSFPGDVGFLDTDRNIPAYEPLPRAVAADIHAGAYFMVVSDYPKFSLTKGRIYKVYNGAIALEAGTGVFCKGNSGSAVYIYTKKRGYVFYGVLSAGVDDYLINSSCTTMGVAHKY